MKSYDLRDVLIEILTTHTACIAHEINDRAYNEHDISFESFRNLRETRDSLLSDKLVEKTEKESPYGKPFKFYYLRSTPDGKTSSVVKKIHKTLLDYSKKTDEIGRKGKKHNLYNLSTSHKMTQKT
ncbi:hypothetical protein GTO27_01185 [Candidatus Bathyarchaeota archaeon]|nr:hypothetical protein [Candidatus Bathyarchaeota archaeon]